MIICGGASRALVAAVLLLAACDEEHSATTVPALPTVPTASIDATGPPVETTATTAAATTAPTTAAPTTAAAPTTTTTLPIVTSTIVGTAVAGNSGGVGADQTDSFSEAVRNEDGTCSGWDGPGDRAWTAGLEVGAAVRILSSDTEEAIGSGSLVASSFADVDPTDREQWNCVFSFSATVTGEPAEFLVAVAGLEPWLARPDPTRPGEFVASVSTIADPTVFSQCTDDDFGTAVTAWTAAGLYWSNGLSSICSNGLHIEALDRPCRPPEVGSDHVISVVLASDPSVVLEDLTGLRVDPATLAPGTPVVVRIAVGRPC